MAVKLYKGTWLVCENGHRIARVDRDVHEGMPLRAADLVDRIDGLDVRDGHAADACPQCGAAWNAVDRDGFARVRTERGWE